MKMPGSTNNFWVSRKHVAQHAGLPYRTLQTRSRREGWEVRTVSGPSGRETQVLISSLPEDLRAKVLAAMREESLASVQHLLESEGPQPSPEDRARLARATPNQLRAVDARRRVLILWRAAIDQVPYGERCAATADFCAAFAQGDVDKDLLEVLGSFAPRTLIRWEQAFRQRGPAGLLDKRGRPRGGVAITGAMRAFVWRVIQARPQITAAAIHRLLSAEFPRQSIPIRRTLRRLVKTLRADNHEFLESLHQPSQHKRHYQPALGRADAGVARPNQVWEIDSTRSDILARRPSWEIRANDGKRYTMIAVMDVFSRRPVARLVESGGGYYIGETLISAIRKLGLPEALIMDLGKDYQSILVRTFCADLGIEVPEVPGYTPEAKPHVERFFDTIQSQLFAVLPGYVANKVDNRQEIISVELSRQELQEEVNLWIQAYERREHGSTGETPLLRGNPEGWCKRTVPEDQLRMLLSPPVERSIRACRIKHNRGTYWHPELKFMDGSSKVLVRDDPDDAGIIHIFDLDGEFLFRAEDITRLRLTPQQINEERKAWTRSRRAQRQAVKEIEAALDLRDLNRRALQGEVDGMPDGHTDQGENRVDLPGIREAVADRENSSRPSQVTTLAEFVGGLDFSDPERRDLRLVKSEPKHPLARPEFFMDLEHRFRWTRKRQEAGLPVTAEDLDVAAEFTETPDYKRLPRERWEADALIPELQELL